jgi:outer membrane protein assembly factor BamD (BamD/ComL family)
MASVVPSARGTAQGAPSASAPLVESREPEDLAKEQLLLDTARAALARGRANDALAAVASHAAQFPRGRLAEDREAIAVQALAAAGRTEEARLRAKGFRVRYPRSIYLKAIERSLAVE